MKQQEVQYSNCSKYLCVQIATETMLKATTKQQSRVEALEHTYPHRRMFVCNYSNLPWALAAAHARSCKGTHTQHTTGHHPSPLHKCTAVAAFDATRATLGNTSHALAQACSAHQCDPDLQGVEQAQELAPEGVPQHGPTLGVDKHQQGLGAGGHVLNAVVLPLQL